MPKNRYYHYDHETCSFVEVRPDRRTLYLQMAGMAAAAVVLAFVLTLGMDRLIGTPEELVLEAENEALQEELSQTRQRIDDVASRLDELSDSDQRIYRVLLGAQPISEDVRQAGVGGTDPYQSFNRFTAPTARLLRQTTEELDQIERKISLQNTSYRELTRLAETNAEALTEMPAILPANGPVVSGYGMRRHPILKIRRMHKGIDIVVPRGTPVYATGDGVIEEAGRSSGFGNHIVIRHEDAGYKTLYAHLSKIGKGIRRGRSVKRGEQIGLSGNTGLSSGPHLHYEVHDLEGRALNPVSFFAPTMTPKAYKRLLEATENASSSLD